MKRNVESGIFTVSGSHGRLFALVIFILSVAPFAYSAHPWWNAGWRYRFGITVGANGFSRFDKVVDSRVNFTQLLGTMGQSGALDANSIRVIETNAAGTVLDAAVPYQFDRDADYNAATKASGALVLFMAGTTAGSTTRYYDVYFEVTGGSFTAPSFTQRIGINENDSDMGQAAYRIDGPGVSMYYQKEAGAFSSIVDAGYNDWIGWNFQDGPGGTFRGIPNPIRPESYFHPGALDAVSTVLSKGPLKVTIRTVTGNGKWECLWEFYPRYATMTMVKKDHDYWILYEGVPGGSLEKGEDFMYRSDGTKNFLYDQWATDIPGDEWIYFSDPNVNRSLFLAHHEKDSVIDSYFTLGDTLGNEMTVFGFGRSNDPLEERFITVPQHFTIGLIGGTTFATSADTINASYQPLSVTNGSAEQAAPDAPALLSPAAGATGVGTSTPLIWRSSLRATNYRLQVSTSPAFASTMFDDSTLTDTVKTVPGLQGKTTYYWRTSARNSAGSSAFSGSRQFQTALGTPSLVSPANAATGQQVPVIVRWTRVTGATGYHLQAATNPSFSSGIAVDQIGIVDSLYSLTGLLSTTTYYWRVSAADVGGEGSFSAARSFTTSAPAPQLVAPPNDAVDQPLTVKLVWRSIAAAIRYHVQVSTDAGFGGGIVLDDAAVNDTSKNLPGLNRSTRYYWRVSAVETGGEGPFSSAWNFSTYLPPPALLFPSNASTGQTVGITLRWASTEGATRYHLQLATDAGFTVFVKNDTTITDTVRLVNGLAGGTWHYWRVSARNGSTASPFSPTWSFRTLGQLPGAVSLLTPAQDGSVAADSVLFSWRKADPSTRYWLEIGLDSQFALKFADSTVTDTVKGVRGLLKDHTYWWKVRGGIADAWGPFSETRNFVYLGPAGVDGDLEFPTAYALGANYPNPFNPSTMVTFALPVAGEVRIEVYSMLGERVATLVDEVRPAGNHAVRFDASGLASGTYFTRMSAQGKVFTRRMLLLR